MRKMKRKNINLYEQYQKTIGKEKRKKLSTKTTIIIYGGSGILVLVGVYVVFYLQYRSVQKEYDFLYEQIYSEAAAEQSVNAERLEYENQILQLIEEKHAENRETIEEGNKQTRKLYPELIEDILQCQYEDTRINMISFDQGIVFISVEAKEPYQASGFVSELDSMNIFSNVTYLGYARVGDVYIFSATGDFDVDDERTVTEEQEEE
ncbi:MAG: hypothetical protein E7505_01220 [Ruminococcus sp.]|nr:hypothetical protein [Ruminococcus sp.]